MRKRLTLATVFWLAVSVALATTESAEARVADLQQQDSPPAKSADQNPPAQQTPSGAARKKAASRTAIPKKKGERSRTTKKKPDRDTGLAMEPGIVCKSIDGYEIYAPLPGAAQTSDEKLLVYFLDRWGFQTEKSHRGRRKDTSRRTAKFSQTRGESTPSPEEENAGL